MGGVISDGVVRAQFAGGTLRSRAEHTGVPAQEQNKNQDSKRVRRDSVEVLHCTNDLCAIYFYILNTSGALEIQIWNEKSPSQVCSWTQVECESAF